MKILLTGGAGYVGSACLRHLLRHGHDPIAFDDLSAGNAASVPGDRLIVGDILDPRQLTDAMKKHRAEAVMHFAAVASVPESIAQPELYWRINVAGTKNVLDAMAACGVHRIVFSSSAATFGFHDQMPITEAFSQAPQTPYGTTKLACEWIIQDYSKPHDIGYACLRYFNAGGADLDGQFGEDRRHESHLIPLVLQVAIGKRDKVMVYGGDWETHDGTCVRDYIHTDDLAQAHRLAIEKMTPGRGEAYNLGSGNGVSVLEVVKACEKAAGRPIPYQVADRRPGDPAVLIAGSEKIKRELGWRPQYEDVHTIVDSAWRWHNSHPNGYAKPAPVTRSN
jgi:UDP-glucose 4-epimerase